MSRDRSAGLAARVASIALGFLGFCLVPDRPLAAQYPPKPAPRIRWYDSATVLPRRKDSTAAIEGLVRDGDRPLAGVAVVALGVGRVAVTDGDGRYRLADLPAGAVELTVGDTWLDRKRRLVTLRPGDRRRYDLQVRGRVLLWCDEGGTEEWAIACRAPRGR